MDKTIRANICNIHGKGFMSQICKELLQTIRKRQTSQWKNKPGIYKAVQITNKHGKRCSFSFVIDYKLINLIQVKTMRYHLSSRKMVKLKNTVSQYLVKCVWSEEQGILIFRAVGSITGTFFPEDDLSSIKNFKNVHNV